MPRIRAMTTADLTEVRTLNDAHAAEVNALGADALAGLVAVAAHAWVVDSDDGGGPRGFLIAFDERTPAQGPNHGWFLAHEPSFIYIDRVVVAAAARGQGLARALYAELAATAGDRPLCCEVNVVPINEPSLAFHARLGFVACGEVDDPRNGKRVRYLVRR